MECKEFTGLIPDFLHDALDETKLSEFLSHVDECENCMDELRIQYLIYEGLERLETGATFDVDKDLSDRDQEDCDRGRDHDNGRFSHRARRHHVLSVKGIV